MGGLTDLQRPCRGIRRRSGCLPLASSAATAALSWPPHAVLKPSPSGLLSTSSWSRGGGGFRTNLVTDLMATDLKRHRCMTPSSMTTVCNDSQMDSLCTPPIFSVFNIEDNFAQFHYIPLPGGTLIIPPDGFGCSALVLYWAPMHCHPLLLTELASQRVS